MFPTGLCGLEKINGLTLYFHYIVKSDTMLLVENGNGYGHEFSRDKAVAISEITSLDDDLKIYPNPAGDMVKVSNYEKMIDLSLYDIYSNSIPVNFNDGELDLSKVSPGIYFIHITTGKSSTTLKLVQN